MFCCTRVPVSDVFISSLVDIVGCIIAALSNPHRSRQGVASQLVKIGVVEDRKELKKRKSQRVSGEGLLSVVKAFCEVQANLLSRKCQSQSPNVICAAVCTNLYFKIYCSTPRFVFTDLHMGGLVDSYIRKLGMINIE